ncbi:MAG: 1-deoxy-D-xylulose-5-phosphate synthase [Alphaproteobacteria bacterium]|nr:1-deoxy-D-xylulose-5-phosphate synthase [Alphaproteobacteria bacterium]
MLEKIRAPQDIKSFSMTELELLSEEIREAILNRVSQIGGHVGPNLGVVELVMALHYVFDSPVDKIVFDVSHQCYTHKILTGRKEGFLDEAVFSSVSGYTAPQESPHDHFVVGHTSTSLSLATGLAKARDLKKENHNVIAVIGDGSLGGGEALEGLNFAGEMNSNLIIVVNDNELSIAPNHGGLYQNLKELRESNGTCSNNFFKAMGLEYVYIEEGNDLASLINIFNDVKNSQKPIVVHVHTDKGHGYSFAESEKEKWHYNMPFDIKTGESMFKFDDENYNQITIDYLSNKIKADERVVVVNAGTPGAIGFTPQIRDEFKERFIDVGIMEEHAVAMSSALAKEGCKPIFWVLSSFVQRTYDQLSHDLALNKNPAVILVSWGGIGSNDATHLGIFDMSMMSNIPNLLCLAPASKEEYLKVLDWAVDQTDGPVVIRVPNKVVSDVKLSENTVFSKPHFNIIQKGSGVALIGLGSSYWTAKEVAGLLAEKSIKATLINPLCYSQVDEKTLLSLEKDHEIVVTIEDGIISGGLGQKIASFLGSTDLKVLNYGAKKEFTDRADVKKLFETYHLTPEKIVEDISLMLN